MTLRVSALYIHPIKSARAVPVASARLVETGFEGDRAFMVVDEQGTFISQRESPALARLHASIEGGRLSLRGDSGHEVVVALDVPGEVRKATVWDDEVDVIDCGPEAAGLVTTQAGAIARLVRMADGAKRPVDQRYAKPGDIVSFADGFPVLVTTTASIRATLADAGVVDDTRRFRPNIVIEADEPFVEDRWSRIQIGDAIIDLVKPCGRCSMVDVDPATGERSPGVLATLAKTRSKNNKVLFAQNGIPRALGVVRVGDAVTCTSGCP